MAHKWLWLMDEMGPGNMNDVVAHTFVVTAAVKSAANKIAAIAEGELLVHRLTGASHIATVHYPVTDLDSYVELRDSHEVSTDAASGKEDADGIAATGKGGAAGIEKQHHVLANAVRRAHGI